MNILDVAGWTLFIILCGMLMAAYFIIELVLYIRMRLSEMTDAIGKSIDEAFHEAEMKELEYHHENK